MWHTDLGVGNVGGLLGSYGPGQLAVNQAMKALDHSKRGAAVVAEEEAHRRAWPPSPYLKSGCPAIRNSFPQSGIQDIVDQACAGFRGRIERVIIEFGLFFQFYAMFSHFSNTIWLTILGVEGTRT